MAELDRRENIIATQARFNLEYDIEADPNTSSSRDETNHAGPYVPYEDSVWPNDSEYDAEAWEWRIHKSKQRWERR
eukprot:6048379-Pleurochrysis_carterae.AAC.1